MNFKILICFELKKSTDFFSFIFKYEKIQHVCKRLYLVWYVCFENALVTVNYSNLPHSQDYLAPGNKHATDKIAAELCIHAFYLAMNVAYGVVCSISGAK